MKKTMLFLAIVISVCIGSFYVGMIFEQKRIKPIDGVVECLPEEKIVFNNEDFNIIDFIPVKTKLNNPKTDLTNEEKVKLGIGLVRRKIEKEDYNGEEIKAALTEEFGSDLEVKLENVKCECEKYSYIYDSKTDVLKYNHEHGGHGLMGGFSVKNYINNYEVIGNIINIDVVKIFYPSDGVGPVSGYYISYEDAVKDSEKDGTGFKKLPNGNSEEYQNSGVDYFEEIRELEKDKLPVYTYTFEKVGNNFIFKGYELSK